MFRTLGHEYREQRPGVPLCGTPPPPPPLPTPILEARRSTDSGLREDHDTKSTTQDKSSHAAIPAASEKLVPAEVEKDQIIGLENVSRPPSGAAPAAVEAVPEALHSRTSPKKVPVVALSDKIHLGGFNVQARYLLHALSGLEGLPPVQVLTQNHKPSVAWGKEGRSVAIHDHLGNFISERPIICPQYVGPAKSKLRPLGTAYNGKTPMIDNLVVSLDDHALVPFMHSVKRFISSKSTICLLSEGLGVMEDLNRQVFTDPRSRPQYICGLSHHQVSRHTDRELSVRHKWHNRASALYLSTPAGTNEKGIPSFDELDLEPQTQHLLELLSKSPELNAKRLPWNRFVQRKLPGLVHSALADSISVMLGCRYNQIAERKHARSLWNTMLTETLKIITAMPEVEPQMVKYFLSPKFRNELWAKLNRQDKTYSRWISLIRAGRRPPVDHFNGYLVRRAHELGVSCKHNHTAMSIVQFKYSLRRDELSNFAGLGLNPYMVDGDQLGGREDGNLDNFEIDM